MGFLRNVCCEQSKFVSFLNPFVFIANEWFIEVKAYLSKLKILPSMFRWMVAIK